MKIKRLLAGILSMSLVFSSSAISISADENNSEENIDLGDINSDGKVDLTDLSELALTIIGDKTLTESQIKAADINENGKADLPDLARLRQYLSKVITSLKNEKPAEDKELNCSPVFKIDEGLGENQGYTWHVIEKDGTVYHAQYCSFKPGATEQDELDYIVGTGEKETENYTEDYLKRLEQVSEHAAEYKNARRITAKYQDIGYVDLSVALYYYDEDSRLKKLYICHASDGYVEWIDDETLQYLIADIIVSSGIKTPAFWKYIEVDKPELTDITDFTFGDTTESYPYTERFFEDDTYSYYFDEWKAKYVKCTFSDGTSMDVSQALYLHKITLSDLDDRNIRYYKTDRDFKKEILTMDKVFELAEKGTDITWAELNKYEGRIENRTVSYEVEGNCYNLMADYTEESGPHGICLINSLSADWFTVDITRNTREQIESFLYYKYRLADVSDITKGSITFFTPDGEKTHVLNNSGVYYMKAAIQGIYTGREVTDDWKSYNGTCIRYDIEYSDGRTSAIQIMNPYIVIDGEGYIAATEECDRLKQFAENAEKRNYYLSE